MNRSLSDLIAAHKMPQKELGKRLGLTEATVIGWRTKGVPPDHWDRIIEELGISRDDLLDALSMNEIEKGIHDGWFRELDPHLVTVFRSGLRGLLELPPEQRARFVERVRSLVESEDRHGERA